MAERLFTTVPPGRQDEFSAAHVSVPHDGIIGFVNADFPIRRQDDNAVVLQREKCVAW